MTILTPEQWALVEAEYVSGSNSLAELAERFEVSEHTIMRHSRCASWRLKRQAVRRYLSASMMEIKKAEIPGSGAHILQAAIKTRVSNMVDQLLSSLKLHGGGDSQI